MTDRISIPALREQATRYGASSTLTIRSTRLLALVEAVEAARLVWEDFPFAAVPLQYYKELEAALARFDFGEET